MKLKEKCELCPAKATVIHDEREHGAPFRPEPQCLWHLCASCAKKGIKIP